MTDKGTVLLVRFDTQESELRTPLGLLYVASALLQAGFRPRIYHEVGGRRNVERLVRLVQETRPLLVGYSIETSPGILDCVRAATAIAATSATPSVWGGIHASSLRDQTARHPAVDYVVVGEGEETIVDLARHLQGGGGTAGARHIPGLAFVDGEEYVETLQRPFIRDLDRYSLPFELVDMDRYLRAYGSRWLSLFTSRGCPFRCGFCYIVATGNNKLREHSPEFVLDQVRWLKSRYAVEGINFFDDEFFLNKKRSMWLGRYIPKSR